MAGLPVVIVGLEKDSSGIANEGMRTIRFAEATGLELVADGSDLVAFLQFFSQSRARSGGSDFVVVSGVSNSPSHQLWEIIYLRTHYNQRFRHSVSDMRRAIDSVQAPVVLPEPAMPPKLSRPAYVDGQFRFDIEGTPGRAAIVQVSSDGVLWEVLKELVLEEDPVTFVDETSSEADFRFYRVLSR